MEMDILWAQALPAGTPAPRAELVALTQALRWGKDTRTNIYTDSRYAFATVHVHGAIYQERGLLTSAGKTTKNKEEILALLEARWLPLQVVVIHCKGHVARGNQRADSAAQEAAWLPVAPLTLLPAVSFPQPDLPDHPVYSAEEVKLASNLQNLPIPKRNNTCRSWEQGTSTLLQDLDTPGARLYVGAPKVQKKDSKMLTFTMSWKSP
nr:uncharacterized protein LOC119623327 [Chlorocebus sabaeus]